MCIFCKIIDGGIPSTIIYEDDTIMAFKDVEPTAPVHILIVPKEHIESCNDITSENGDVIAKIFVAVPKIMKTLGVTGGYRVITNIGKDGNQTVKHLHFHVIGGRLLNWPAG